MMARKYFEWHPSLPLGYEICGLWAGQCHLASWSRGMCSVTNCFGVGVEKVLIVKAALFSEVFTFPLHNAKCDQSGED